MLSKAREKNLSERERAGRFVWYGVGPCHEPRVVYTLVGCLVTRAESDSEKKKCRKCCEKTETT